MPNKKSGLVMSLALWVGLVVPAAPASIIDTANPAFAPTGGLTSIPVGHAEFCKANRAECGRNAEVVDAVTLTEALWTELLVVNQRANAEVVPVTDQELYRVAEYWTYPQGYGDCEDYALEKRRELIAKGWPASVLLLATALRPDGEGHAVLLVRTDRGDLVLDNLDGLVRVWNETPYRFLKRQSQVNQGQWVDIIDNRATRVAQSN